MSDDVMELAACAYDFLDTGISLPCRLIQDHIPEAVIGDQRRLIFGNRFIQDLFKKVGNRLKDMALFDNIDLAEGFKVCRMDRE